MLKLFRMYQGGSYLPDKGGVLDQALIMLEAFDVMAMCEAREKDDSQVPLDADGNLDGKRIADSFKEAFGFA